MTYKVHSRRGKAEASPLEDANATAQEAKATPQPRQEEVEAMPQKQEAMPAMIRWCMNMIRN